MKRIFSVSMNYQEKEFIVSRIVSGKLDFYIDDKLFFLVNATIDDKYRANKIYSDEYQKGLWLNMFTEPELMMLLDYLKYWTQEDENRLKQLNNEIDEFKVKLFELVFKTEARNKIREALKIAKFEYNRMLLKKHSYDHMTAEGFALSCKVRNLLLSRLRLQDLTKPKQIFDYLLDRLVSLYNYNLISETNIREIARTDPWRTIWLGSNKNASIFQSHPYEMSDEQKLLLVWSVTYDSIYQSVDCPHDSIIEDDDILDGWMILQRRKREKDLAKKEEENLITNPKIRNANEIFVPVDTTEDAKKVNALNSFEAQIKKQQKMNALKKHKTVAEQNMPDSKEKIMMEIVRLGKEANVRRRT